MDSGLFSSFLGQSLILYPPLPTCGWLDALRSMGDIVPMRSSGGSGAGPQFQKGGKWITSTILLSISHMELHEIGEPVWGWHADSEWLKLFIQTKPWQKMLSPPPLNLWGGPGENKWKEEGNGKLEKGECQVDKSPERNQETQLRRNLGNVYGQVSKNFAYTNLFNPYNHPGR